MSLGFDFEVLLKRRPELAEQLSEFKEHMMQEMDSLRTGEDDSEDIKVWQLQVRVCSDGSLRCSEACGAGCLLGAGAYGPNAGSMNGGGMNCKWRIERAMQVLRLLTARRVKHTPARDGPNNAAQKATAERINRQKDSNTQFDTQTPK